MIKLKSLNNEYSTTRLGYKLLDDEFLDENGKIRDEFKFKINNSKFKIQNSKLIGNPEDKFEAMLFLPEGEGRKGEGGLRTKGYFKFSYENLITNDECLILKDENGNELKVDNSTFNIKHSTLDKLPLISIITVVYNGEKYLEETIKSVINQTYSNIEYIIIDGGSTDGTLDIIKKYKSKINYWVSESDKGISDAFNKGIILSHGDSVLMLNAGDIFNNNDVLFTNIKYISLDSDVVFFKVIVNSFKTIPPQHFQNNKQAILNNLAIPHQGAFIKKNTYKKYGLYNINLKIRMDYDMFMRLVCNNVRFNFYDNNIVNYLAGGMSMQFKNRFIFIIEAVIVDYYYGKKIKRSFINIGKVLFSFLYLLIKGKI